MNQNTIAANPEAGGSALRRAAAASEAYAPTMLQIGWIAFAVSMLGLGMLGFITGDFALNWQPVPADVPGRTTLAYVTAALFWTLGAGLLFDRFKYSFAIATAVAFLVWAILLHGPGVVRDPLNVLPWLGFTERLQVAAGALMLATTQVPGTPFARWGMLVGKDCVRRVPADLRPVALGLCAVHGRHDSGVHSCAPVLGVLHRRRSPRRRHRVPDERARAPRFDSVSR